MTDSFPRRSIIGVEPSPDGKGVAVTCDCATTTVLVFEDIESLPEQREAAFTCDGCQTTHWFRVGPMADGEGSPA